jgi:hypothetical protein
MGRQCNCFISMINLKRIKITEAETFRVEVMPKNK